MNATRLVCFGGEKDGREVGVLDHEREIKLATFRQRQVPIVAGGSVMMTENYRVMLVYRRGKSPRSGRECLVFVRESE